MTKNGADLKIIFIASITFLLPLSSSKTTNLTCYSCDRDGIDSKCFDNETCIIASELYKETICLKLVVDHSHGKEKVHRSCETEKLQEDVCQAKKDMLELEHLEVISCSVCGMNLCNVGYKMDHLIFFYVTLWSVIKLFSCLGFYKNILMLKYNFN